MSLPGLLLVALAIAVGLVCIVVPILPGGLVVFAAIAVWAVLVHTTVSWVVLGIAATLFVAAEIIKFTWPVKRMRRAEVATRSLLVGGVLGVIGFFVIPVLGMALGFMLGVYVAEYMSRRSTRQAWASTVHAVKAIVLSMGVELAAALASTLAWVVGVLV